MSFCLESGYLYSVDWSPTRHDFACGTHRGNIVIYDIMENGGMAESSQTIFASDGRVYSVSFNKQRSGYLASGDKVSVVKIWNLAQNFTNVNPGETSKLNDISEKTNSKSSTIKDI